LMSGKKCRDIPIMIPQNGINAQWFIYCTLV